MVFESRNKRQFWYQTFASLIFEGAISVAGSWVFDGGMAGVALIFFGLQAIYFITWLRKTLFLWFWWRISGREQAINQILSSLETNDFPPPDATVSSPEGYLSDVVEDEELDLKTRFAAKADATILQFLDISGQILVAVRMNSAYEEALQRFRAGLWRPRRSDRKRASS